MTQHSSADTNGQSSSEPIFLTDATGRSLPCAIERSFEIQGSTYLLVLPLNAPIAIIAWDDEDDADNATWIEDDAELQKLFPDAKAVLAEQELLLEEAAYTLTVAGELPEASEDDILTMEVENEIGAIETDEYQFLATFYHQEREYEVYTPLDPLLFFARELPSGELELLSPEDFKKIQPFIEDLLFE